MVGIVVGQDLKNKTVHVKMIDDRILSIKFALRKKDFVHVISAYALQVGLDE